MLTLISIDLSPFLSIIVPILLCRSLLETKVIVVLVSYPVSSPRFDTLVNYFYKFSQRGVLF